MVQPRFRARTFRRIFVRTPGGNNVLHHKRRKPSKATCAITGQVLHGVPQAGINKLKSLPKSQRRPERPYGGVLSSKAMRRTIINKVRA